MRHSLIDTLLSTFLTPNSQQTLSRSAHDGDSRFFLVEHGRRNRALAENYITKQCAKESNTRVIAFTPRLFTLRVADGSMCGSFGLRSAHGGLLIEQFLDHPIEHYVSACSGSSAERRGIVEVDHLCCSMPTPTSTLLAMLVDRVHRESFRWLVLMATSELLDAFRRIGLVAFTIEIVRPERLRGDERAAIDVAGRTRFIVLVKVDDTLDTQRSRPERSRP